MQRCAMSSHPSNLPLHPEHGYVAPGGRPECVVASGTGTRLTLRARGVGCDVMAAWRRLAATPVRVAVLSALAMCLALAPAAAAADLEPLALPDTSSPRATLRTFLTNAARAAELARQGAADIFANPGFIQTSGMEETARTATAAARDAAETLDFSHIPPALLARTKLESVLMLHEILRRVPVPADADVPDAAMMDRREGVGRTVWLIPGTPLQISRATDESRSGDFLFSPKTVSIIAAIYEKARRLPPRDHSAPDAYQAFVNTPGGFLVPPRRFGFIARAPDWVRAPIAGQALFQWIMLAIVPGIAYGLALSCYFFFVRRRALARGETRRLVADFAWPLALTVATDISLFGIGRINIAGSLATYIYLGLSLFSSLAKAWCVIAFAWWVSIHMGARADIQHGSIDVSLLRMGIRGISLVVAALILALEASRVGLPLVGIVASLGVGGLAIALAAQPTIENLIAGTMLYMDQPVRVGDRCKFGDMKGTIEDIGIRSTRIRATDGSLIVVTNADFAKLRLVNLSQTDRMALRSMLRVTGGTSLDQVRALLATLRDLLEADPRLAPASVNASLIAIGDGTFDIDVRADIITSDPRKFDEIREELLFKCAELLAVTHTRAMQTVTPSPEVGDG